MRLIDADKLKGYIKLGIDCGGTLEELYNHFDSIPTAYDVDKVCDELINAVYPYSIFDIDNCEIEESLLKAEMVEDIVRRGEMK